MQPANAAGEPTARPLLVLDPVEETSSGTETFGRGQPGVGALGAVAGLDQPFPGARIAGLLQVIRDRIRVGVRARQQRLSHPPMPEPAARWQDAFVERFSGQCVDEANAGAIPLGFQEMSVNGLLDDRQQRLIVKVRHLCPDGERHLLPDDRRDCQWFAHLLAEPSHPPLDDLAQERRNDDMVELTQLPLVIDAVAAARLLPSARSSSVAKNGLPSAC